jgi:hypothetical protein
MSVWTSQEGASGAADDRGVSDCHRYSSGSRARSNLAPELRIIGSDNFYTLTLT